MFYGGTILARLREDMRIVRQNPITKNSLNLKLEFYEVRGSRAYSINFDLSRQLPIDLCLLSQMNEPKAFQ